MLPLAVRSRSSDKRRSSENRAPRRPSCDDAAGFSSLPKDPGLFCMIVSRSTVRRVRRGLQDRQI
jgi:hypothetical protein